jgi:hypothetical protein
MRRLIIWTGTIALLAGSAGVAWAQDDARALIERAVQAHGGAEALGRVHAEKIKFKGTMVVQGHTSSILVEKTLQLPSKYKSVIEINSDGEKHTIIHVVNRDKTYVTVDGRTVSATPETLAELRSVLELERAQHLLPLLEDKSYQLTLAEEIKVNDRPAVGVRITGRGRREMRLYFDKEHGLLVRAENRLDAGKDKEIRQHFFYGDYKETGGYKRPTKLRAYRDGTQVMEAELLDAKPLEKVDETEFAKP